MKKHVARGRDNGTACLGRCLDCQVSIVHGVEVLSCARRLLNVWTLTVGVKFRQRESLGKGVKGWSWVGSRSLQLPDGAIRSLRGAGTEAWGDWNSEAEGSDVPSRWLVE